MHTNGITRSRVGHKHPQVHRVNCTKKALCSPSKKKNLTQSNAAHTRTRMICSQLHRGLSPGRYSTVQHRHGKDRKIVPHNYTERPCCRSTCPYILETGTCIHPGTADRTTSDHGSRLPNVHDFAMAIINPTINATVLTALAPLAHPSLDQPITTPTVQYVPTNFHPMASLA